LTALRVTLAAVLLLASAARADFLEAALGARAVVLGRVGPTQSVDRAGRVAPLAVEQVIAGQAPETLRVAWEELAPPPRPRLPEGARVLLALDPFPGGTLWLGRFPEERPLVVAERGEARVIEPSAEAPKALAAFLATPAEARGTAAALPVVTPLLALPDPPLARAGLAWLARIPGLSLAVSGRLAEELERALVGAEAPEEVRRGLLSLAAEREIRALRPAAAKLTEAPGPLEAPAWSTLAALDGGLPPETVDRLLARPGPDLRAAGVGALRGPGSAARLRGIAASDPTPEVRIAALRALRSQEGAGAADALVQALGDPGAGVSHAAALLTGELGDAAVPALQAAIDGPDRARRNAAIATLSLTGPEGQALLVHISRSHPDREVRKLAELSLGKLEPPGH
jgi:hypothetical protein